MMKMILKQYNKVADTPIKSLTLPPNLNDIIAQTFRLNYAYLF